MMIELLIEGTVHESGLGRREFLPEVRGIVGNSGRDRCGGQLRAACHTQIHTVDPEQALDERARPGRMFVAFRRCGCAVARIHPRERPSPPLAR
jgi:hypothetical protein